MKIAVVDEGGNFVSRVRMRARSGGTGDQDQEVAEAGARGILQGRGIIRLSSRPLRR